MKKLTGFHGRLSVSYRQRILTSAIVIVCSLLLAVPFTGATAQAFPATDATASYTFSKAGDGITTRNAERSATKGMGRITFYPEVVTDYLLVMLPAAAAADMLVTMRSVDGTAIARDVIAAGATNTVMDLKHVQPGDYVITVDISAAEQMIRLVKN